MNMCLDVPIFKLSDGKFNSAPSRSNAKECRSLLRKLKFLWALGLCKIETAEKVKKDNAARIKLVAEQRRALVAKLKLLKPKFELYTGKPLVRKRKVHERKSKTVKGRWATTCPSDNPRSPIKVASREDGLNVIPLRAYNTEAGDAVTVDLYHMNNDEIQKYLSSSKI